MGDEDLLASLFDPAVRWVGEEETAETCHSSEQVLAWYGKLRAAGVRPNVRQAITYEDAVVLGLALAFPHSSPSSVPTPTSLSRTLTVTQREPCGSTLQGVRDWA